METYQTLENAGAVCCDTRCNIPQLVLQLGQLELLGDFLGAQVCGAIGLVRGKGVWVEHWASARGSGEGHTAWDILLVGKDQKQRVLHFAIVDNLVQLRASLLEAGGITRVHNEDKALCAGVVVSPERANLVLTADIPHIELDVLIGHALDVESDGGDGSHVLVAEFQFVKNS